MTIITIHKLLYLSFTGLIRFYTTWSRHGDSTELLQQYHFIDASHAFEVGAGRPDLFFCKIRCYEHCSTLFMFLMGTFLNNPISFNCQLFAVILIKPSFIRKSKTSTIHLLNGTSLSGLTVKKHRVELNFCYKDTSQEPLLSAVADKALPVLFLWHPTAQLLSSPLVSVLTQVATA